MVAAKRSSRKQSNMGGPERPFWTVAQACEGLKISKILLRRLRARTGITGTPLGTCVLFSPDEFARLKEEYQKYLPGSDHTATRVPGRPLKEETLPK